MDSETIENKVQMILRQTDYTKEEALQKLLEYNYDPILVIKKFLGIPEKKRSPIISVNQEIYRQLRCKLDDSMRDYQSRVEENNTK
jgi:hypothetical protein